MEKLFSYAFMHKIIPEESWQKASGMGLFRHESECNAVEILDPEIEALMLQARVAIKAATDAIARKLYV